MLLLQLNNMTIIGFKTVLMEQNNSKEFLDAIFTTVALLSVETSAVDESPFFLLDLLGAMQDIAIKEMALSTENRFVNIFFNL